MPAVVSIKQLKEEILSCMKTLGLYDESLIKETPNTWEKYGDLVLFQNTCFVSSHWLVAGESLWELICDLLKCKRIGLRGKIIDDDFRTPKVNLVYGQPGEISFTDNGIIYTWDMEHSMFCRGNASERHRIAKLDCSNEVIVDLFSGIGYFTLPYLVKAKAKVVHACEWNPYAVKSLRRNLELNKVLDKCIIHEGDNRKFAPKNIGNRINVGLIPDSQGFWRTACEALISSGGFIYIHQNITSNLSKNDIQNCSQCSSLIDTEIIKKSYCLEFNGTSFCNNDLSIDWKHIEWFNFSIHILHTVVSYLEDIYNTKWKVTVNEYFKIKSYAPHIDHLVFSVHCLPL